MGSAKKTMPKVEIFSFDGQGAELPSRVAAIEIKDPVAPPGSKDSYCIGFRLIGSDPLDSNSWVFNHTNRWDFAEEQADQDKYEPDPVSQEEIEALLAKHGSSLEEVLEEYCQKLREKNGLKNEIIS